MVGMAPRSDGLRTVLILAASLNLSYFAAEFLIACWIGSGSLLADLLRCPGGLGGVLGEHVEPIGLPYRSALFWELSSDTARHLAYTH